MASESDAFAPAEVATRVEAVGVSKAKMPIYRMAALAVLAGAFIGMGGIFFLTATTDVKAGYGAGQVVGGLVFSLGLILVVVAGAELFTGNNLLVMAAVSGRVTWTLLLMNWVIVFLGNLLGALSLAVLAYYAQHWAGDGNLVGARALAVGVAKAGLPFGVAFFRGVLCNALVCLAVWLCFAAHSVTDKILAILFPISAFVAAGFEHSVANMFFLPYAILLKAQPGVVGAAALAPEKLAALSLGAFGRNLLPVTLGNIVGGGIMVGFVYWVCYLWGAGRGPKGGQKAA